MIVVKLQGGLGNQLFQWAFAKNLSLKYNVPLYFDLNFLNQNISGVTKRNYSLDKFPNLVSNFFSDAKQNNKNFLRFSEPSTYMSLPYDSNYNWYLDGYFQSEKYFIDSQNNIKEELKPSPQILENLLKIPFINANNISLHVRRTDYLTSNGFHPVQTVDYYKNAIDEIGHYDYIFVFSDDIEWCRKNLNFDNVIFMSNFSDIEDFWIMSMCKNNIIANSSFSWWAAWLNSNINKKVVAPQKWFGQQTIQTVNDIIPNNWIKI